MKEILSMVLVIVLVAGIAISGTMAYLTDRDNETNVFTVGDVDIELEGSFAKGVELLPGKTFVTNPLIENVGKNAAWVWLTYAVPANLADAVEISETLGADWKPADTKYNFVTDIDEDEDKTVEYAVTVLLYDKPLAVGADTSKAFETIGLDSSVDVTPEGDWYTVVSGDTNPLNWNTEEDGAPFVFINAYAIQQDQFASAEAALAAYINQWGKLNGTMDADPAGAAAPVDYAVCAKFNGGEPCSLREAVEAANAAGGGTVVLLGSIELGESIAISKDVTLEPDGDKYCEIKRSTGFEGTMFTVAGGTFTVNNIHVDGGAEWTGEVDATLGRGTVNSGITATGNIIAASEACSIVLNEGTVLKNNDGGHAVNLGTRKGATLTMNGSSAIINNNSSSGAVWGGGNITLNDNAKINANSSSGIAGAIRMVSNCNLTMNGGAISNNKAAGDGGAIWGYGSSTYNFNGGEMSGNESAGTGGAIYTGTNSVINISGDFELCDNKAADSGAIRLTNYTSMNMTGGKVSGNTQNGESNAFNTWNNYISITGGELADNMSYVGGLSLNIGAADIDGVIYYDLSTNHNTAYLAADFNGFKFAVNEADSNFNNFNFKPAADYTYTAGDEGKLLCQNEGYTVYWDAATSTFRLKAD